MRTKDMTTGSPTRNIVTFAIPVLLGFLFQQLYNLTDTVIAGRFLGEDALAAVGSTGSIVFLVLGITSGLTQGFGVLIASAFGGRQMDRLRHLVAVALMLTVVCSVAVSVPAVLLSRWLLIQMNCPADVLERSNAYIRVIYAGILFSMSYNVSVSILRAVGDSRTPLYFLIFSSFLNIVLDIFCITVLKLGTAGVGLATITSQGVSAVLCFLYMFRNFDILRVRKDDFYLDRVTAFRMLRVGIPMAVNCSVTALGITILQSGINVFGVTVMAAYSAASKVESIISQAMMALGTSMSTFCGQNNGAGKLERVQRGIRQAVLLAFGISATGMVFYFDAASHMIGLFVEDPSPQLMDYALRYLHTSVWFLFPLSLIYLFRSSLIGLGNGLVPMMGGMVELTCRSMCIGLLLKPMGYRCVCLTNPITWIVTSTFLISFYIRWEKNIVQTGVFLLT